MNLGSSLIKMFQIVEMIGKLVYIPVYYRDPLLKVLYSAKELASFIQLPYDLIFEDKTPMKNRYWMKFHIYKTYENVFQSEGFASLVFATFLTLIWVNFLIMKIIKPGPKYKKLMEMIHHYTGITIEVVMIDMMFGSFYNLITNYELELSIPNIVGKSFSFLSVSVIIFYYLLIAERSMFRPWRLNVNQH
jgi:hypothetical protein